MRARFAAALCGALLLGFGAQAGRAESPGVAPLGASVTVLPTYPPGAYGALVRRGQALVVNTQTLLPANVTAKMSCAACHVDAGRTAGPLAFLGEAARYPQFSRRANRYIGLRDRIAECFLYSMNGTPPAYYSPDTIAIEAYIAFLSKGSPVGESPAVPLPTLKAAAPNRAAGAKLYATQCAACHGANGAGNAAAGLPPLWGATSFNDKAGMDRVMPQFVKLYMPLGRGGTLTDQQATDVAAYVLAHPRPHFNPAAMVRFPPEARKFF